MPRRMVRLAWVALIRDPVAIRDGSEPEDPTMSMPPTHAGPGHPSARPESTGDVGASPVLRALQIGQHALFLVLLVLGAGRAAASGRAVLVILATVLVLFWYGAGAVLARRRRDRLAGAIWFVVLALAWLALVSISVEFSWVAFPLFFLSLHLLPPRAGLVVVAAMTAVVVVAQLATPNGNRPAQILGPCLGALVAVGMSLAYRRLAAENMERRTLVVELLAAQEDLVATHDMLAAVEREAGALGERARLARDIHDTLAQGFSSILLLARAGLTTPPEAATASVPPVSSEPRESPEYGLSSGPAMPYRGLDVVAGDRSDALRALLTQIEATAADNLDEARRVVHALTPASLEATPLPGALERLLARVQAQGGPAGQLRCDGEPEVLPASVEVALLRLAQGALANVRQHARATRVGVALTYGGDEVRLDVVDDGVGFDPLRVPGTSSSGAGFGLRAMRERLAELGGTVEVESSAEAGTAVVATVPLHRGGAVRAADPSAEEHR